jgi:hypothetical protein
MEVGSTWYVTDIEPAFTVAGALGTPLQQTTFTGFDSLQWRELMATVGSPFAVGATTTPLPAGTITGFGVFWDNNTTNNPTVRFDTFQIGAAIPEPSCLALLTLGLGARFIRRRRD